MTAEPNPVTPLMAAAAAEASAAAPSPLLTLMARFVPEGPPEAAVTNSNVFVRLPNLIVSAWPARSAPVALAAMANVAAPSNWKSIVAPDVEFTIWNASGPFTAGTYELLLALLAAPPSALPAGKSIVVVTPDGTLLAGGSLTAITAIGRIAVVILAGGGVLPKSLATMVIVAAPLKSYELGSVGLFRPNTK